MGQTKSETYLEDRLGLVAMTAVSHGAPDGGTWWLLMTVLFRPIDINSILMAVFSIKPIPAAIFPQVQIRSELVDGTLILMVE